MGTPIPPAATRYMHRHVLTRKGLNLLAKKETELATPNITKVVAGACFTDWDALEDMTGLAEPIAEMEIGEKQLVDGKTVRLPVQLSNLELTETALIRQIGVFSLDPDEGEILYQVVQYDLPIPLPAYAANSGGVILFDPELDILFRNGETASTPVTPGFLVTAEAFEDRMQTHNTARDSHQDIRRQISQILASEVDWEHIPGKPEQFEPAAHTHGRSEITDFPASLPASGGTADAVPWSGVTGKPASFTPASHTHGAGDIASGTLPVSRGGTGAATAAAALTSLGAAAASHSHTSATTGTAGFLTAADKAKLDKCPADVNSALANKAATASQTGNITFASGYTPYTYKCRKDSLGNITLIVNGVTKASGRFKGQETIGTLPSGFRPTSQVGCVGLFRDQGNTPINMGFVAIFANGNVDIAMAEEQPAGAHLSFAITFF